MPASFAFYIHHHGSGHLMRAIAIARALPPGSVSFLGSSLHRYKHLIPEHITCFELPVDVAGEGDEFAEIMSLDYLHYAPLNIKNVAERSAGITAILNDLFPVLLIVDVSVEVTLLATLSGIPTVVIRQNGNRNDVPHLNAYQSARLLLAPCSRALMDYSDFEWVDKKTFFSGGFSRYTGLGRSTASVLEGSIGVMTGTGGTSMNIKFIRNLARQCTDKTIHVIGKIPDDGKVGMPENIILLGTVENPAAILSTCKVVIGNAGHNTVMEMADLNKYFICIPEARPFEEQVHKAKLLNEKQMAVVVDADQIQELDWNMLIVKALSLPDNRWADVINPDALNDISKALMSQYNQLFRIRGNEV